MISLEVRSSLVKIRPKYAFALHWEPRITGLEVYSGERGGIILKPTEMGVATARWSLTAKMREAFMKILMQA